MLLVLNISFVEHLLQVYLIPAYSRHREHKYAEKTADAHSLEGNAQVDRQMCSKLQGQEMGGGLQEQTRVACNLNWE